MNTMQCPSQQELSEYDLGKLTARRRDEISEHLDECQACSSVLAALDEQGDDLIGRLRETLPLEILQEDSELHRLVEAAAALQNTAVAGVGDTQPTEPATRKPPLNQIVAQLLAPALAEDELGRLGGYRVLAVLGVGGMGVVFKAEDPALKRLVALKAMLPNVAASSDSARASFLREAQATAAIHHDHIVTIHQVGQDGEVPFLAMQLLEGESLATRLGRERRLPISESCRIAREIATGLAAAHAKGLTHRDIKPDNIWLEGNVEGLGSMVEGENIRAPALNSEPSTLNKTRVKILDFGLARANDDDSQLTQAGAVVGTPSYLAPEQALGQAVDARADLFSLGVVLYQMLTDQKPFHRDSIVATLRAIDRESPPPPASVRPDVPQSLSDLVMRLLQKEPDKRLASAKELVRAIQTIEESLDESPAAPHPVVASHKAVPRWRALIATAAAITVVVLAGIIIKIRDKDGKVIATIEAPNGVTAETESDSKPQPTNTTPAELGQQTYLPPMSPMALVQQPPQLVAKDGEVAESWTVLPVGVTKNSTSALSADGLLLAAFGQDGVVRVWDVEKKALHKALIGHAAGPCSPAGKPSDRNNWAYIQTNSRRFGPIAWRPKTEANAPWLATASRDGSVRVWDVANGTTVWTDKRDADFINMLAWSPDGTKLAVGYDDGQVRTWEAADGKELNSLSLAEGPPFSLGWSPDSKFLAVHSALSVTASIAAVHVWDAASGKQQRFDSTGIGLGGGSWNAGGQGQVNGISAMKWSPDGKHLAYKGVDCVLVLETSNWQQTQRLTSGMKDNLIVQDFDWSPDGTSVLVSWNGQLVLHGLRNGEAKAVPLEKGQLAGKVIWAPDSTQVALWIIDGPHSVLSMLETQSMTVRRLSDVGGFLNEFLSDSSRLLVDFYYPAVLKLEADKVTSWSPAYQPWQDGLPPSVWSPDGTWMTRSGSFWKLSANDGPKPTWTLQGSNLVSWSPDSTRFLASTGGHGINYEFWSPDDRKRQAAFETSLRVAAWSPDGLQVAIGGGYTDEIRVLDGKSGQVLRGLKVVGSSSGVVPTIAWSRRGERMAVFHQHDPFVIDAIDGKVQFALEGAPAVSGYQRILWGPEDRHILVVGVEELAVFAGDTGKYQTGFALGAITRAIHFHDADTALCGTRDGTVHRLELATGKQKVIAKGLGNVIEISPDGQKLAVDRGGLCIHKLDGQLLTSFLATGDPQQPFVIGADGHFWSNDHPQGPFWATKGSVPHSLVYVVQTAKGQQTLTPLEFANRYGWQNDPGQVRLK